MAETKEHKESFVDNTDCSSNDLYVSFLNNNAPNYGNISELNCYHVFYMPILHLKDLMVQLLQNKRSSLRIEHLRDSTVCQDILRWI